MKCVVTIIGIILLLLYPVYINKDVVVNKFFDVLRSAVRGMTYSHYKGISTTLKCEHSEEFIDNYVKKEMKVYDKAIYKLRNEN